VKSKQVSAQDAVGMIASGDTVVISGNVSLVVPEMVLQSLGECFRRTGQPKDLLLLLPTRPGWKADPPTGLEHLAQPGLVRRIFTSTWNGRDSPAWTRMAIEGGYQAYSYPMGTLFRLLREVAAGSPGFLTQVGLNTYADPGAVPAAGDMRVSRVCPPQDLVRRMDLDGEPYLFYRTFPIDVAVIRGTVADPDGNISLAGEPVSVGVKYMAMAARNSGGRVIAQVKHMTARGTIHPRMVEVPGTLVDAVVVDPHSIQSQLGDYEPALTGEVRTPNPPLRPLPFSHEKIILRRAAMELEQGDIVNLGVGIGTHLPSLAVEEEFLDDIVFSLEHGGVGGLPAVGTPDNTGAFGAHYNPWAIVDSLEVFDFYHGGGLDATFLGFAQVDAEGNINVGWFSGNLRAPGGFLDITCRTRKLLFCGTLTAGGTAIAVSPWREGGARPEVRILQEGRVKKFLPRVEQVNLHGPTAAARGQRALVVTERGVFRITAAGLELIEVAPGIDIETHIRPAVDCDFRVSSALCEMDPRIFAEGRMPLHLPPRGERRRKAE
jgi:acyl CoA:acetate/3-ketoacid CoA transferase